MRVVEAPGISCEECNAPMGKMIDKNGDLLGYACYGRKQTHTREATEKEIVDHDARRIAENMSP